MILYLVTGSIVDIFSTVHTQRHSELHLRIRDRFTIFEYDEHLFEGALERTPSRNSARPLLLDFVLLRHTDAVSVPAKDNESRSTGVYLLFRDSVLHDGNRSTVLCHISTCFGEVRLLK